VWAADITYIPMAIGFCYLVAVMDWASRMVSGGLGCLDRKQGFISEKLCSVNVHAAACFCG
jgi:hypothetical protein